MQDLFENDMAHHEPQRPVPDMDHDDADSTGSSLSDLDYALIDWARRHGADELVAQAFGLASHAISRGHTSLLLDAIDPALMSVARQRQLPAALTASDLVGAPGQICPLILDHDQLYLQRYHAYETRLAARLQELLSAAPVRVATNRLLPGHGLFTADDDDPGATNWQAVAAFVALRQRFTVISGGPGTGKTYSIVRLLRVLIETALAEQAQPPLVALAAPTGKAAARMAESIRRGLAEMSATPDFDVTIETHIPQTAYTLHRLLGLTGASTQPRFDADNPLPADVVIVDEASMVDLPLMAKLASAIRNNARLILLGDRYQLASVESGSVLAEVCANAGINSFTPAQQEAAGELLGATDNTAATQPLSDHVVTLQTSRRFNADSAIGQLAVAANAGDSEGVQALLRAGHDALGYHDAADTSAINRLVDRRASDYASLVKATGPEHALQQLDRQCILTAIRGGPAGSEAINASIKMQLARRFDFNPDSTWYHGRPIMITRNDYRAGLYNGDLGIALRDDERQLRVWFATADDIRAYLPSALPAHATAYAMTIHKSQGSEFDAITLVLPDYDVPVLTRELLYTGLTRARSKLTILARPATLDTTTRRRTNRHSGLARRLAAGLPQQ